VDAEVYLQVKEALMGHSSVVYHQYGSESKVEERVLEAMRKAYHLLCLSADGQVGGSSLDEATLKGLVWLLPDLEELVWEK
jgi:hypothetical protein